MGAYLDKPVKTKESEEGEGAGLIYGASCMQGWRVNQEDAHNCLLNLAEGWSMFAVYDGHGGSEVSKYTADNLPQFFTERKFWESSDLVDVLQKTFVDFDDHIRSETVMKELKKIANDGKEKPSNDDDVSDDEEERFQTIEESKLPLEELLVKYGYSIKKVSGKGGGISIQSLVDVANDINAADSEDGDKKTKKKRPAKSPAPDEAKRSKSNEDSEEAVVAEEEKKASEEGPKEADTAEEGAEKMEAATEKAVETKEAEGDMSESEDDSSFAGDEEEEEDEEDDEDDEDEEEEGMENLFMGGGADTPGEDSGTTACVCFVSKDKVIVVNAGDSRAVLSRDGKAVDLSIDHKPTDDIEKNRIEKAGGKVHDDGRVNGGLNLSRALGDHTYKKNTDLPLAEQMISAFPDVKMEDLQEKDEFLVVACDGIWNSLESQEVVDFVRTRLNDGKSCKEVAEALCDHCLADSTQGDGTGCDNMTVIITKISH